MLFRSTGNASSGDSNYNNVGVDDVSVTNTDDDTADVVVDPTSGLTTTEAEGTDQFNVRLTSEPTADVTISLTSTNTAEGTVPPNVILTSLNWQAGVDVTVTGVDDEHQYVRFSQRRSCLAGHFCHHALLRRRFQAAGVNQIGRAHV